jgi:hypothetical protein
MMLDGYCGTRRVYGVMAAGPLVPFFVASMHPWSCVSLESWRGACLVRGQRDAAF